MVRSDKFKTGKEQYVDKAVCKEIREEIPIGTLPVMVNSDLCWMKKAKQGDCDFDHGGYFIIKGAEKVKNLFSSFPEYYYLLLLVEYLYISLKMVSKSCIFSHICQLEILLV